MALPRGLLSCQNPAGGGVAADALVYGYTQHSAPLFSLRYCRGIGEKGVG
jgi:hypothetical protein